MTKKKIALVGIGKIARDQHIPSLHQSADWELVATVSRNAKVENIASFESLSDLLDNGPFIDAVSICVPPTPRFEIAKKAILAGKHVMLEKPPGASLAEVFTLEKLAAEANISLFASWHSRMAKAVGAAKTALENKKIIQGRIIWKEDVRRWHPGQNWVFEPGGMGVFDPGINALSILTEILPVNPHLLSAQLFTPKNRQMPIAVRLEFTQNIVAEFDWRQEGKQTWTIELDCANGQRLKLVEGGNAGDFDHKALDVAPKGEYPVLYDHFAQLVSNKASDVDLSPMIHVADAMTLGQRTLVEEFQF